MRPDTETAAEAAERRVDMLSRYESGGGGHAESVLTSVPIVDAFCVGLARDRNDSTTAAAPAQEREVVCILGSGNWYELLPARSAHPRQELDQRTCTNSVQRLRSRRSQGERHCADCWDERGARPPL